jgi:hypothetical protein
MTSPYAEKALSERAAGTKGAWTQLRSGNLSAGECSLSAKVTKFTLGRFYCHSTDSYRNRTPPRGGVSGGRTWRLPTDRLRYMYSCRSYCTMQRTLDSQIVLLAQ